MHMPGMPKPKKDFEHNVKSLQSSLIMSLYQQDAQLSQRDRAAGLVSNSPKWKTGTGRQYFTNIIGLSSTTVT